VKVILALVVGYVVGAKTGGKELDELRRSVKALGGSDELADVVSAARIQLARALREVAEIVGGARPVPDTSADLVEQVRHLVGQD
jgi:hypothetical protein